MTLAPLVSVCLPVFNGSSFLEQALDSVRIQTYPNIELVVSDDSSSDNSMEIVQEFANRVSFPVRIFHHSPAGIGANWNNCLKNARGEYIKFLFQDDLLLPDCIAMMVNLALSEENIGLVYCRRQILFDRSSEHHLWWVENYRNLHDRWYSLTLEQGVIPGRKYLADRDLLEIPKNKIGEPPVVMISKECLEKCGYFNTRLKQALDMEYWYRLMPYYKVAFLDEELVQFRLHPGQASFKNLKERRNENRYLARIFLFSIFRFLHLEQKIKLLRVIFYLDRIQRFFSKVRGKLNRQLSQ